MAEVEELWDNTKLSAYMDCEMKGKLGYEEHLTPAEPSEALVFGEGIHKMVEVWTKQRMGSALESAAIHLAKEAFLTVWEAGLPPELREKLEFEGNRRSYANACRLFEAYTRKFPLEMYDKIVATETPFTVPLGHTPAGREIQWSGILDRAVIWQGGLYYVDVKTSSYSLDERFFNTFRLSGQMLGYTYAGEKLSLGKFDGVMIQGIEVKAPPKTARGRTVEELIQTDIIAITPEHVEEWRVNTLQKIDDIHRARERKHWVMNFGHACNNFNGCAFKRICDAHPGVREQKKSLYYQQRVWNPLTRGRETT
jgi:hypothetical protein